MAGPLQGIRVLELAFHYMGPYCGGLLADMGAEVIKIEDTSGGDMARGIDYGDSGSGRPTGNFLPYSSVNYLFECMNRGKRSIALNLRVPEAAAVVYRLIPKCDVFLSNVRELSLESWGLDYESLSKHNPKIIWAAGSGFGHRGIDKDLLGMDLVAQARGGLLSILADPGATPPHQGVMGLADAAGAIQLLIGTLLALVARERTGIGQQVRASLLGGIIALTSPFLQAALATGENIRNRVRSELVNPLRTSYQTKDGRLIAFNMTVSDRHWHDFCLATGIENLETDPRFCDSDARKRNASQLVAILDQRFASKNRDEWLDILRRYRLVFGAVNDYREVAQDPQLMANGYIAEVNVPGYGLLKELGITVQLSKTPGQVTSAAPECGKDTEEILLQLGDYSWDEISSLRERRIIP